MIYLEVFFTLCMVYYAGFLFRCEYYFARLGGAPGGTSEQEIALSVSAPENTIKGQGQGQGQGHEEGMRTNGSSATSGPDHTATDNIFTEGEEPPRTKTQNPRGSAKSSTDTPDTSHSTSLPKVSVIIPARNEASHIPQLFQDLQAQDYPRHAYEVILVNDHSEDATRALALEHGAQLPQFQLVDLSTETGVAYKKAAVASGIAQAKGEIILVTDADCRLGPGWIRSMASSFSPQTGLVSGPVLMESETVFEDFQALEFMGLIAVGAGSIGAGAPNMCNGANLAYRKTVFHQVGGFTGIDQIASGDDELLMHKIARETDWEIRFAHHREAIVRTYAHRTWAAFRAQRLRWVSKGAHYQDPRIQRTMVLSYLAILGLPVLLIAALIYPTVWPWFLLNLGLKVLADATILRTAAKFFDKLPLLRWLLPEQLAHIAYVLWVGIAGNQKSYTWKGRKVH